jgi:CRISPR-associated protein Csb2
MRKKLEPNAAPRRSRVRSIIEVRVGDRFVRWVGAARARRLCQDRELAAHVIPARPGQPGATATGPGRDLAQGIFSDDLIVLARVDGRRLPITSVAGLARQFRRALMAFADQPVAEVISGHRADGAAAETPHLAVVPLPAVTGPRPDGTLLGIALVLPRDLGDDARGAVMRALARFEDSHRTGTESWPPLPVLLGDAGVLVLQRVACATNRCDTLRPTIWIGPARRWASATPIALDRNPGELHHADPERRRAAFRAAAACVSEAVRRIGLPAPVEVDVLRSCALPGTAEPQRYPRFPPAARRLQRVLVHARLRFDVPVRGPILVGAGRYQGLGLLLPDDEQAGIQ